VSDYEAISSQVYTKVPGGRDSLGTLYSLYGNWCILTRHTWPLLTPSTGRKAINPILRKFQLSLPGRCFTNRCVTYSRVYICCFEEDRQKRICHDWLHKGRTLACFQQKDPLSSPSTPCTSSLVVTSEVTPCLSAPRVLPALAFKTYSSTAHVLLLLLLINCPRAAAAAHQLPTCCCCFQPPNTIE
jgi:hypothetical protein